MSPGQDYPYTGQWNIQDFAWNLSPRRVDTPLNKERLGPAGEGQAAPRLGLSGPKDGGQTLTTRFVPATL